MRARLARWRASSWRDNPARSLNLAIAAVLIGLLPFAVRVLLAEREVEKAQAQVEVVGRYLSPDSGDLGGYVPLGPGHTARARLLNALILSARAHAAPVGGQRDALLAGAETWLRPALGVRPHWGEAQVVAAYVAANREGPETPAALAALQRSYADAPFLPDAAQWRVTYGMAFWPRLPNATRKRVVGEAIWLAHVAPTKRRLMFELARGSEGYIPFSRAWALRRRAG